MSLILIGGGARSGKSRYAITRARACGSRLAFLGTATPSDTEMAQRIAVHRAERGAGFELFEEPLAISEVIASQGPLHDAIIVDCLTLWLNNLLFEGVANIEAECSRFIAAASAAAVPVIAVTNEVGCGIVPDNAIARTFRDLAGLLNRDAAASASEVYWMVFGIPQRIK